MSLLAKQDKDRGTSGSSGPGVSRPFLASHRLRLQSFREAVASGDLPEGTIWLVRIIEAGQSINGKNYTAEALREAAPVFEGVTVQNYSWSGNPADEDADHLPENAGATSGELQGNKIGALEGVFYNEEAQALDGFLKVYDADFREALLTAFKLGDVGEGGKRDTFGFSIDAAGVEDENQNVIAITEAHELTAVNKPAAGGRIRRLVASATANTKATHNAPGELAEQVAGEQEDKVSKNKAKLMESLGRRVALRENALEDKARMDLILNAFQDEMGSLRWGDRSNDPVADKVAFAQTLTRDLADALTGMGAAPAGSMQESVRDARLRENAATLAGKLKLWADQLSTAADEDVPNMLETIRNAITEALDSLSGDAMDDETTDEDAESQEAASVDKKNEAKGATAVATQDDFARMSAGMTESTAKLREALKTGDPVKLREAAVQVVGEEPELDEKDKQIAALQEKLRGQAIDAAMSKLGGELRLAEGAGPMVLRLIDRASLKFDDEFSSEVGGLKEAIQAVVKDFPGFVVKEQESSKKPKAEGEGDEADKAAAAADAAAAKQRESQGGEGGEGEGFKALTPQEAAQAVMAKESQGKKPLGQDVSLRESARGAGGGGTPNAAQLRQLKRYERQMLAGNSRAMKKHRDLRTQLGL